MNIIKFYIPTWKMRPVANEFRWNWGNDTVWTSFYINIDRDHLLQFKTFYDL